MKRNATKFSLKTFLIALSATLLLTACGKSESEESGASDAEINPGDKVICVSLGDRHSAAVTEDGSLYMWGLGSDGILGNGENGYRYPDPIKIMDHVKSVSLGKSHSAAITEDGSLYMWGFGGSGMLGNGKSGLHEYSNTPIKILDNVKSVSLGSSHSAAITENGDLYVWGSNDNGKLGCEIDGYISTTPVKAMEHVKSVSLGEDESAAITEDGSLYVWGHSMLGNGTNEGSGSPVKIMDNVKEVSLGYKHKAFITEDGGLYLWGYNDCGQIGNGESEVNSVVATPVKIMDNVKSVSLGWWNSAAITEDGSLYTWGKNKNGELGNGTYTESNTPVKVMDNVKSVSLGNGHSAAITENGTLYMWGYNNDGQLGNGKCWDWRSSTDEKEKNPIMIVLPPQQEEQEESK